MLTILILILGFLFGSILQYAKLNRYNTISGLATIENFAVAKAIAVAIGTGIILINIEIGLGLASYHIKPLILGGVILGGFIFGSGMAILGYCPGTLPVSLGEGSLDALIGIIGGLFGGLIYTLVLPSIQGILGPDFGTISLNSIIGNNFIFYFLAIILGALFIWIAFLIHKKENVKDLKWLYAGIALAVLDVITFSTVVTDRPIGASTTYPYLCDYSFGLIHNNYFEKIQKPGSWELIFLFGAFLSALIISVVKKEFKLTLIHSNWKKYKGSSPFKRILWSFIGGFILIIGARMADGCTSGHILSGGMQLSISSLIFAVFVFIGLLVTGKYFYKKN
ncbi:MAG: transporter [Ignavibacteriales bacterium CG_4_9_14_3_um_filter_34_10]|nr:MAG: transporter [Ignavibacteriales bacterium CG_4_9_14_3_um_filter_34_10]